MLFFFCIFCGEKNINTFCLKGVLSGAMPIAGKRIRTILGEKCLETNNTAMRVISSAATFLVVMIVLTILHRVGLAAAFESSRH